MIDQSTVCITRLTMAGCHLFQQHCVSLFKLRQERVHTVCFQCVCVCVCLTIRETVLAYACAWVYRRECNNCLRLIPKCDELCVRVKIFLPPPYFLCCTLVFVLYRRTLCLLCFSVCHPHIPVTYISQLHEMPISAPPCSRKREAPSQGYFHWGAF